LFTFHVKGMTCAHCSSAVGSAIRRVESGARIEVDLEAGRVTVAQATDRGAIVEAIRAAGYETE